MTPLKHHSPTSSIHAQDTRSATAVIIGVTSVPPTPAVVRFDHPFVYLIRDVQTGAILFAGRVADPSAS